MKKKIIALCVAAVVVFSLTLPPVQAAAVSSLSLFRVGQAKTIKITLSDIEFALSGLEALSRTMHVHEFSGEPLSALLLPDLSDPRRIESVGDFTAFSAKLPRVLSGETPELYVVDSTSASFTLNTAAMNEILAAMQAGAPLDPAFDGRSITVSSPPALLAKYENVMLFATQGALFDADRQTKQALYDSMLSLPFVPESIRAQLEKIDVDSRDVYLPEITGFGRAVMLGSADGYIYSLRELESLVGRVIVETTEESKAQASDAAAIVWTEGGVLYCLIGEMSDFELAKIAESVR